LENVLQDKVTWCSKDSFAYFIGLLNYDKGLRPDFGRYYSFDLTSGYNPQAFVEAIQLSAQRNVLDESLLFGYESKGLSAGSIVNARAGTEAQAFIKYRDCEMREGEYCPIFAMNSFKNAGRPVIGYFTIDDKNDVYLGLVYNRNDVPVEQLKQYRSLFVTRVVQFVTTGTLKGWVVSTPNYQMIYSPIDDADADEVVNLQGPEISEFYVYSFKQSETDESQEVLSYDITGTQNVNVNIKVENNASYCIVYNIEPDGEETGQKKYPVEYSSQEDAYGIFGQEFTLTEGSGLKFVGAYCISEEGIPSHKTRDTITLDTSGIELIGRTLPDIVDTREPYVRIPKSGFIKARSRYAKLSECWLYPKQMTGTLPPAPECGDTEPTENYENYAGCCYITDKGRGLYFWNADISCISPYISETNKYIELELKCRDEFGTEKPMGTTKVYRWSAELPDFELPNSFIFSTNGFPTTDAEQTRFWFDPKCGDQSELYTVGDEEGKANPVRFSENGKDFVFSAVKKLDEDTSLFNLIFVASDEDGMQSCTASVQWWKHKDYTGELLDDDEHWNNLNGSDVTNPKIPPKWECTPRELSTGDPTKIEYTCPLPLQVNAVNNITVTCQDKQGQPATRSFRATWDEEGPIIENFNMEKYLEFIKYENRRREDPNMFFTLKDLYTPIGTKNCKVRIALQDFTDAEYDCTVQSKLDTTTGSENPRYADVTCVPTLIEGMEKPTLPIAIIDWTKDKQIEIECKDDVNNVNLTQDNAHQSLNGYMPQFTTDNIADEIIRACNIVRHRYSQEQIEELGFADEGIPGSVEVRDEAGNNQLDEDGVTIIVYYDGTGDVNWDRIISKYQEWQDRNENKIVRNPECASQAVCSGVLDVLTIGTVQTAFKSAQAAGKGARMSQFLKTMGKTFVKNLRNLRNLENLKFFLKFCLVKIAPQALRVGWRVQDASQCRQSDPRFFANLATGALEAVPIAGTVTSIAELAIPDPFELEVCHSELKGGGLYIIRAKAAESRLSDYLPGGSVLEPCFAACDDFACQVVITKIELQR
ncbi:MAG: hypothetical protein J7K68_00355, partial [Candidatus Diapherotrites archaeon]|nr:hypothetical protein [Candidatus Diapherotrites archaeon]